MEHCCFPGTVQGAGDPDMKSQGPALLATKVGWDSVLRAVHRGVCLTWLYVGGCVQMRLPGAADSKDPPCYGLTGFPTPNTKPLTSGRIVFGERVFKEVTKVK